MKIRFSIDYHTHWGQNVMISGNIPELGAWDESKALNMNSKIGIGGRWEVEIEVAQSKKFDLEYKYFIQNNGGTKSWEWGDNRNITILPSRHHLVSVNDFWRAATDEENTLFSSAFINALLRPNLEQKSIKTTSIPKPKADETTVRFQINVPRIDAAHQVCVVGENQALGAWDSAKTLILEHEHHPLWTGEIVVKNTEFPIHYKYGIYNPETQKIDMFEAGENRVLAADSEKTAKALTVRTDEKFRYPVGAWKGAGVAIPVFSLRTEESFGVGEFLDIKKLVDWAKKTGLKLVQILPINDTTAKLDWGDCYPYASISVFALHPIYINLKAIGSLSSQLTQKIIDQRGTALNQLDGLEYADVIQLKFRFLRQIYQEQKASFLRSRDFETFYDDNKYWLAPYGAFSYLRDLHGTPDFSTWGEYSYLNSAQLDEFIDKKQSHYEEIAFYYFLQFHADKQLKEATNYAREHGIVLKGDIAIGIFRNSVDAWSAPQFFNMDGQAGAPPDDFSATGQNWKFPTYNWEAMEADGYTWWTKRMQQMAHYFDSFRIDHILGFFRIWEIPHDYTEGLMGAFNKSLPATKQELSDWGIWFDYERLCKPYIREHFLNERFFEHTDYVKENYLEEYYPGCYRLKPQVDTQRKVEKLLTLPDNAPAHEKTRSEKIKQGLLSLHGEVIFFDAPGTVDEKFNPRNAMQHTKSFQELDGGMQARLNEFYTHYFYKRHEDFWRGEGLRKLPVIKNATNMLICGEDLGMVPDCVPGVMKEMGMLSLEVQRMPKNPKITFGHPADYPYMSVATPSSHDTSTIRGWWQEDTNATQKFYNEILGHWGGSPFYCEPWIVRDIVVQHLYSPSMWAIFPIQDLIGMDEQLRLEDADAERINEPSNPNHYWRYRFHIKMEDLLKEDNFNETLRNLITQSGRNTAY